MLPTAHIASALLCNRLLGLNAGVSTAVLGSLVPDAIDKTLAWVLRLTPSARHAGHTPLAAMLLSLGASAILGRRRGVSFGAAYLVHLVGDLWHGGHVPWLMPFKKYDAQSPRWRADLSPEALLLEAIGAAIIVVLARPPIGNWAPPEDRSGSAVTLRASPPS